MPVTEGVRRHERAATAENGTDGTLRLDDGLSASIRFRRYDMAFGGLRSPVAEQGAARALAVRAKRFTKYVIVRGGGGGSSSFCFPAFRMQ